MILKVFEGATYRVYHSIHIGKQMPSKSPDCTCMYVTMYIVYYTYTKV